jgi:hypothetical protein
MSLKIPLKLKTPEVILHGLAITITYSECVENHHGMEQLGHISTEGFTLNDLFNAKQQFENMGAICEVHCLNDALIGMEYENKAQEAYLLIIRNGVNYLLKENGMTANDMMKELTAFSWDTQALMRGKLVNKHARHNVCFTDTA